MAVPVLSMFPLTVSAMAFILVFLPQCNGYISIMNERIGLYGGAESGRSPL